MSLFRRIISISFTSIIGILLAIAVMFVLFVYPNPDGLYFSLLKLLVLGLTGYLFYHLYSTIKEREKDKPSVEFVVSSQEEREHEMVTFEKGEKIELERSIQLILELFTSFFPKFSISAYLKDYSKVELVQWSYCGVRNNFRKSIPLDNTAITDLMESSQPQFIIPNSGEELFSSIFEDSTKISPSTTVLVAQISVGESNRGILLIEAEEFSEFDESHREIAASYAELIAMSLKQFEYRASLRSDNLFYAHLEAFQNDLDIDRSENELLFALSRFCESTFSFDKLTISLIHDDHPDEAVIRTVSGFTMDVEPDYRYQLAGSLHGKIILDGEPLRIENLESAQDVEGRFVKGDISEHQFLSFLGVPIKSKNSVVGALVLESFSSRKYSYEDLIMLQVIGERSGVLLDWWKNYGFIKETAMRDGLTGLLNHLSFMERFDEEINRANRYQENLVLLILDLDKFKRINDNHGHLYGDYVLEETANSLKVSVRNIDLIARYGGEEFAIILVNATKEGVFQTTKRIINNIEIHEYKKDGISVHMTISAGAAEFPSDGTTTKELIAKADEAMYEVKRRGGNDVILASSPSS